MRKVAIILGSLIAIVAVVWTFLPELLGVAINLTCRAKVDESCQARMRSLGHVYSARGDLDVAIGWYEWAARSGDRIAMFHAGWAHRALIIADMQARVEKAVKTDGRLYVPDNNGPHDIAAANWYRASAEAGFAPAMNNLGQMYRYGVAGDPDPLGAFIWHSKSAVLGNPIGQLNLAADFQQGFGTRKNLLLAQYWADIPTENKDPADLAEPTFSRTSIVTGSMVTALKEAGELPANWDLTGLIQRVRNR